MGYLDNYLIEAYEKARNYYLSFPKLTVSETVPSGNGLPRSTTVKDTLFGGVA